MQLWTTVVASARGAQRTAQEIEAAGWDGMLVVDSQNLSGDPYVSLALAATVTTRIVPTDPALQPRLRAAGSGAAYSMWMWRGRRLAFVQRPTWTPAT